MGSITTAKKSAIVLLGVLVVLLAISFLPFGSNEKSAVKEKTVLLQQIQELNSLPPAIDAKIEPAVKEEIKEALYLAAAAKTKKEEEERKKIEVLVKASSEDSDKAAKDIKKAGGEVLNVVDSVDKTAKYFAVKTDANKVAAIAADDDVSSISERGEVYPTLDSSVPVIKADSFWNAGYKGSGVRVAVLDTGMENNHPMLKGKVVAEKDFTSSGSASDDCGHGTHVAGIVAGSKANGGTYDGVAPDAQLLNAKVLNLDSNGKCGGYVDYIIAAIGWALDPDGNPATDDGARVISMSLGGKGETSASLENELKSAVAKGAVVVVSSGNCGSGCPDVLSCGSFRGVTWPGNSPSVVTVGAVDDAKNVACFSSGENVQNVGIKPDITAPGVDVTSSVPGSGYESKKGTSMAAPHVSGAVALLLNKNPVFSQGDVLRVFEKTALDLGSIGKDTSYGFGLIDMAKALNYKEGLEVNVELEKQVITGSTQKITAKVYDDVTVNSVKATITKPNNVKTADVAFTSSGSNVFTYDFTDTALMGNYVVDVAVNYGGTGGSSGTGSEGGGEAGSGTDSSSSITVTRTAYFKVTSLTGDFGNVEEINVSQQQKLSSNITGTIKFANTATVELNFSALLQLLRIINNTAEVKPSQEIRLQPVTIAAGSKAAAVVNNALDVGPGNYALRMLTDYGAGSLVNETNITVSDDLAPQVVKIGYSKTLKVNDAQTIIVEVDEHQNVQAGLEVSQVTETAQETLIKPITANYTVRVISELGNRKTIAVTIFNGSSLNGEEELDVGDGYAVTLQLCDESGNCYGKPGSGRKDAEYSITACSGKRVLAVKTYDAASAFEEAAAAISNVCLSVVNKSVSGTPPGSYLERFDAVVWTTGTDLVNIDGSDAAALTDYYGKKGRVVVEGSDVAFRHGSDSFMRDVLHSELKTDLGFTVTSVANMSSLSINITRQHPVVYGLQSPLQFNATIDPFPDAVAAANGGVELAAWSGLDTSGAAAVAYESENGSKKSLLLPFSTAALNGSDAKALAANSLEWLLEGSAVDVMPLGIKYGGEYPLIIREIPPGTVCIAVCVPKWKLKDGACELNECGSACGTNNVTQFDTKENCDLARQYYESGAGSGIIVEGSGFNASAMIGSSEKLASPLKVKVLVDSGASGASEGEAALIPATTANYSYNYSYNFGTTLGAGQHTVTIFAGSDLSISERNYVNNIKDFSLTVYPKLPDLQFGGMSYSYDNGTGLLAVNLSVSNLGGAAAAATVKAYLDGKEAAAAAIELSAAETKTVAMLLPSGKGVYDFKAVADANDAVQEHNESNNELQQKIYLCSKEKVLVVDDNDAAFFSTPDPSSSDEFMEVLRNNGYCVDAWDVKRQGVPGSSDLSGFKAVIWTAGDYFNGTISNDDAIAIGNYSEGLLLEGSDIGLDDSEIGILQSIAAAAFSSDMLLNESQNETLVLKNHSITANITTDISISKEKSPYPDSVEASAENAEVVAEWQNGKAAIVASVAASASSKRRTAYYAFSVDGITDMAAMEKLVINTMQWLLVKPNNAPTIQNLTDAAAEEIGVTAIKVTMKEGETKNFSVLASDPDGDPLTYKWLLNGSVVSTTYYFAFSPKYNESGSYNLTIIVSDGQAEARAELLVTVLDTMECDPGRQTSLCPLQLGVCAGSNVTCDSKGKWPSCTAATYLSYSNKYEVAENSCDGLDNDCDGKIDEGFGDVDDDKIADCADDDNDNDGTKDKDDDLIGNESSINFTGDVSDDKKLKIRMEDSEDEKEKAHKVKWVKLNHSDKPLLQFRFNFSKGNVLLRNLTIEKQKNDGKEGFTLVKGLDLKGKRKQVFVDRVVNSSNAVCVKDEEVSAITEVTSGCGGENETLLQCDFPTYGPPYARTGWTCPTAGSSGSGGSGGGGEGAGNSPEECEPLFCQYIKETRQFQIYGLKHSAVMEACADADLDTYLPTGCSGGTDCNDSNASINPAAAEVCNGADDNCNGLIDENRVCNTAPQLQSIGNKTVSESGTLSFTVAATDSEGDSLAYNATSLPAGAGFDNATAAFSWTPTFAQSGTYTITFNISDGLAFDYETINITVANVNRAPVFESVGNKTVLENAALSFTVSVTDPDGDSLAQLFVSVPERLASAQFSSSTREFKWTPTFDDSGSYAIWFTASDGQLSTNEFVNVTVVNVNRPPRFENVTNQTVLENSAVQFFINATDPDGQTVSVAAIKKPAQAVLSGNLLLWNTTFEDAGTHEAAFSASDGQDSANGSFNITVLNINRLPVISGVSGNLTVNETEKVTAAVSASDADGDALAYSVNDTRFSQPSPGSFEWSTDFNSAGTYTVLATASDGSATAQFAFTATVKNVNRAPRFENVTNQTVLENSTLRFKVTAADPDGDAVSITIAKPQAAEGLGFDKSAGEVVWTPTFDQAGSYALAITATDGNLSDTEDVNITVLNVNRVPAIMLLLIDPPELVMGEGETKTFSADVSDADNDAVTVEWKVNGEVASTESTMEFTPRYYESGEYAIELAVSDYASTTTTTITLTVQDTLDCETGQTRLCPLQKGVCASSFETCAAPGNWLGCGPDSYGSSYTSIERFCTLQPGENSCKAYCDGLDNDCDGEVDERRVCNTAPVIQPLSNKTVRENETLEFTAAAADAESDALTLSNSQLPQGAAFVEGVFAWTPAFSQAGGYSVEFAASDGLLLDVEQVNVTVVNVNRVPVVKITVDPAGFYVNEGDFKLLKAVASDPDGDDLEYAWWYLGNAEWQQQGRSKLVSQAAYYYFSPNYTDGDGNNVHKFLLNVSDGSITVNVTEYIVVQNTQDCKPKSVEKVQCGSSVGICRQGAKNRTCGSDFRWSGWGGCVGEVKPAVVDDCGSWGDEDCDGVVNNGCVESPDLAVDWMSWKLYDTSSGEIAQWAIANASITMRPYLYGEVLNKGSSDSPPTLMAWYLNGRLMVRTQLPRVNASEKVPVSVYLPYPPYEGMNNISLVLDADNKIKEKDENNNQIDFPIMVNYNETFKPWAEEYGWKYYKKFPTQEECETQGKCW